MTKTFACPFCANEYVVLPTLAGRKVRCTACKNVFILGYDGIAQKVADAGLVQGGESQVEALEPAHVRPTGVKVDERPSGMRSHTRVIKKNTERIQKIRLSLQDAAQKAAKGVQTATGGSGSASATKAIVRARPVQRVRTNPLLPLVGCLLIFGVFVLWLCVPNSVQDVCLHDFCKRLAAEEMQTADRMAAYQNRMWLTTREGSEGLPVLLNIDQAQLGQVQRIEWLQVVAACSEIVDGMEFNRRFALWHKRGQGELIEEMWADYIPKRSAEGFYLQLKRRQVDFVRFIDLPRILAAAGLDKKTVYVVSLLLAGTTGAGATSGVLDFGLRGGDMPTELLIWEFTGDKGNMLVDAGGYYDITVAGSYCGLVASFTGFAREADRCKILDLRVSPEMTAFYSPKSNPLHIAAYESARRLAEHNPVLEVDTLRDE